jgi:hypothetical protein
MFIDSNYKTMKIIISIVICMFFFSCQSKMIATNSEKKNIVNHIKWDIKTIDFGTVNQDTIIEARFHLYNLDTLPLVIYYVNPECGCTDYKVSSKLITPQDSSEITLYLDTQSKQGFQRIITTVCTNSKQKFSKLTLKGYVSSQK